MLNLILVIITISILFPLKLSHYFPREICSFLSRKSVFSNLFFLKSSTFLSAIKPTTQSPLLSLNPVDLTSNGGQSEVKSFVCIALFSICLLQCNPIAFAILDPVDFLALQSIRKSLDDMPGSNYFASWDFTSDPCNFAGVYCDSDKVIALNLGDPRAGAPGLTGRIDPAVGKLSALAELTVVPGRIFGALPQSISQLKSLRFLAVSRNFISGQIPASLGELRNLRTLDLSYNLFAGAIPTAIGTYRSSPTSFSATTASPVRSLRLPPKP
ncbi:putative LRR receptor-like serine/threonine-protein kinase [Prunus yedoensis var. nudiflora]|uniref:Putative LRR receptor-like serine/threonine-protein kinase n=1 Tax=Prunus yedoensis var. nudiflora TaxID=2094558 RepID=A0A314UDS8_PRUYE|nr:putative LRR receptor-like serine/threonine-protein kinase [Prunus yedoensis var. nudiflora]